MKHHSSAAYVITLIFALFAAGLRLWNLFVAVDEQGLPVMHLSIILLIAAAILFLLLALFLSYRSPGRSGNSQVLQYGSGGFLCSLIAAILILLGSCAEFAEALVSGPGISAPIMCLLGLLGGVCCCLTAWFRRRSGPRYPFVELAPILYLLVKLILNFKGWSTDPIILDYCVILFALIFTLLAFYYGAGFVFDLGKPRRTLFCAMAAVFFCAAAIMDGIMDLRPSTIITYGGFLLWQLPVIWDLLEPMDADPVPDRPKSRRRSARK